MRFRASETSRSPLWQIVHSAKLISQAKLADLLSWKNSGFHFHADPAPVGPRDLKGRQRLAEYLLRAPFSLQGIHWNPTTILRFHGGSFEWQAIGRLTEEENALPTL